MSEQDKYKSLLHREGLKSTRYRNQIIDVLKRQGCPMTAEDIYLELEKENIKASLSTVYRSLDALISKNIVSKTIIMDDKKARYELCIQGHRHNFICLGCSKTIKIEGCPLNKLENDLRSGLGFEITGHKLEVYGYCPECRKPSGTAR